MKGNDFLQPTSDVTCCFEGLSRRLSSSREIKWTKTIIGDLIAFYFKQTTMRIELNELNERGKEREGLDETMRMMERV